MVKDAYLSKQKPPRPGTRGGLPLARLPLQCRLLGEEKPKERSTLSFLVALATFVAMCRIDEFGTLYTTKADKP